VSLFYLDTSALVKRYILETGSPWILTLTDQGSGNSIVTADITRVEAAAAIAAHHRAPGGITLEARDATVSLLLDHFSIEYQVVPLSEEVISRAVDLTQQYRLRGYDAVQLAAAVVVNGLYVAAGFDSLIFVASDNDLLAAAAAEGFATENPTRHP
jgi:predicted nucleic acid-binding protein